MKSLPSSLDEGVAILLLEALDLELEELLRDSLDFDLD